MAASAFLSVRLPLSTRDRLKASAAARGETVQGLVRELVERFLSEEGSPPELAQVLLRLRTDAAGLAARGIDGLWVFGSMARGEARRDSDVDLFATLRPDARMSLVGLASLRRELSERLEAPADLVLRDTLRAEVREQAEKDAVRAL